MAKEDMKGISVYFREAYTIYNLELLNEKMLLIEPKEVDEIRILQMKKQLDTLTNVFGRKCVLLLQELPAYMRSRLIEKRINFIIPDKQFYLPDLLINLKNQEIKDKDRHRKSTLIPAAQFLLLYHLLHSRDAWQLEKQTFKDIAIQTGYTQTTITQAVEDLEKHKMIDVIGTKEKQIHFSLSPKALWKSTQIEKRLTNPVLKRVYVDAKPANTKLLAANASAMPEYSDMNPGSQEYYAIAKKVFYDLEKKNILKNPNPVEGKYCIEVWKYDPIRLATPYQLKKGVVDPLSLYLCLQDTKDERMEMALYQMINDMPW
ncbi:MAG: MarR family transcriptional regulator [Saprospiraceae bacterium]|uniref:MarR family transcriptional regulator n=1 Tax=Candidatus Opimibacter skivensis TaxID=2982028 RepID=A0A9D7SW31_9BACT|nr:MarR family transcriptional regulator [Candidatus Opimibacter skivensis]